MFPHRHASLTLRTQVSAVAESLARCEPNDAFALQRLLQQLLSLRALLERDSASDLAPACTLAIRVVDQLLKPDPQIGAALAKEIVTGLVGIVCGAIQLEGVVDPPSEVRAATGTDAPDKAPAKVLDKAEGGKSAAKQANLKLVSSRKLGEMLTQMSLLTPTQVEKALNHQRMTGCRFGEALIEMRVLTKEAVESALRMQDARRGPKGPWGR